MGGRSFYKDTEVLHFEMPSEPTQRFAPMLNIQQYLIEQYAHAAAKSHLAMIGETEPCEALWLAALVFNPPELLNPMPALAASAIEVIAITPGNDTSGQAWKRYGLPDAQAQCAGGPVECVAR